MEAQQGKVLRRCWINFTAANPWHSIHDNFNAVWNPVENNYKTVSVVKVFANSNKSKNRGKSLA